MSAQVRKLEAELGQPWVGQRFLTALADFRRRHPDVELSLVEAASSELLGGVRSGRLDLALAGLATTTPAGLESVLVTQRLTEHPLIALPPHTGGRTALEEGFARGGQPLRVALEAGDPRVLLELAAQELGVAIVAASAPSDLRVVRITPAMRSRLELVAGRCDASPAADAFIAEVRTGLAPAPRSRPAPAAGTRVSGASARAFGHDLHEHDPTALDVAREPGHPRVIVRHQECRPSVSGAGRAGSAWAAAPIAASASWSSRHSRMVSPASVSSARSSAAEAIQLCSGPSAHGTGTGAALGPAMSLNSATRPPGARRGQVRR